MEEINFLRPLKSPRIVRYISGVHMGLSHFGLRLMAKKLGIKVDKLDSGEFLVFMNGPQNAFKMLAPNNILCYYRHPKNHKIDPRIISQIPLVFDGKELDMDKATASVLSREFEKQQGVPKTKTNELRA